MLKSWFEDMNPAKLDTKLIMKAECWRFFQGRVNPTSTIKPHTYNLTWKLKWKMCLNLETLLGCCKNPAKLVFQRLSWRFCRLIFWSSKVIAVDWVALAEVFKIKIWNLSVPALFFYLLASFLSVVCGEVWTLHGYERPVLLLDSYTICLFSDIPTDTICFVADKYS